MKRKVFMMVFIVILMMTLFGITASAAYYEPDGTYSTEYEVSSEEANRTFIVKCVDESGTLLKQVTYACKHGDDNLISLSLYGYDIVGFDSDQGLWETCKITWCSGTGLCTAGYVQIRYYFRTALSKSTMTATVTMRKSESIDLCVRHFTQNSPGSSQYSLHSSASQTIDYYDDVSTSQKTITGYHLKNGYESEIAGPFSWTWVGKYENMPVNPRCYSYDYINTPWSEEMGEYSTYNESSDGKLDYCINRVCYIDYYYDLNEYTVTYHANGGTGAPASQTKYYGNDLTLSDTIPTRSGYTFVGWSTSSSDTSATYSPGDSYTVNASRTLYAVWEKANYEFSISGLTISDSEPYRYGEITVRVRTDNWDSVNSYSDIPVQLYYDGQLLSTQRVDLAAYGVANLTFTLYVGDTPGDRTIEIRINWSDRGNETNTGNNSVSTTIHVKDFEYEMSIDSVTASDSYCAGETVITSFTVNNDSDHDITPDKGNTAIFTAYYYNGSQKVVIATDTWNNVVIPSGKANLVFFKWTVPSNLAGKTVTCECTINSDNILNEENRDNNTATFSTTILSIADSQTPNTRYESTTPGSYKGYSAPASSTEKATWTMWVYENNQFVLKSYGVQISSAAPVITPSADCKTAIYANGKWTIRSGYGFTISFSPTVITVSGYNNPGSSAYTSVQSVYATFPEFNYATINGNCRTLRLVNGKWQFAQNSNAADNGRIHFIPVWFADGNYTVSVTASRVWTPAGIISATRTSNTINIDGSIFDDYYVGN